MAHYADHLQLTKGFADYDEHFLKFQAPIMQPIQPVQVQQRVVDVPVPQTVQRMVPRVETQIIDRQVPRVEVQTVEKIVEVPQVQIVDKSSRCRRCRRSSATCRAW